MHVQWVENRSILMFCFVLTVIVTAAINIVSHEEFSFCIQHDECITLF